MSEPDPWQFNPNALSSSESPWRSGPPSAPARSLLPTSPAPVPMPQQSTPVPEEVFPSATNVSSQPTSPPAHPPLLSSYPPLLVDPDPTYTTAGDGAPHVQQLRADQGSSQSFAGESAEQTLGSAWWLVESWYTLAAPSGAGEYDGLASFKDRDR